VCCAIQFKAFEKVEKEKCIFLLLFLVYECNLGVNKNNFLCTAQFNLRGFEKGEKEKGYIFSFSYGHTCTNRVHTRAIPCVLRNSLRVADAGKGEKANWYIFFISCGCTNTTLVHMRITSAVLPNIVRGASRKERER
jgi:hypothetical protein